MEEKKGIELKLKPHIENILKERYYLKDEHSWEQLSKRISAIHPPMYEYILNREFIPSTPTLMNLNTNGERIGTLSSCFILGIEDSMDGIMDAMKEAATVLKMTGGVGYEFSKLRGASENVKSISANSGGVMAFIGIFDAVLDGVRQGGKRRGAGMSMLSVYHPDILLFIDAKSGDTTKYTRSNFSVRMDSAFYNTLKQSPNKIFKTKNVVDGKENDLIGEDGTKYTYKMLWDKIIHNAWNRAEPGIFNGEIAADRCACKHITRDVFCNPCSEYVHIPFTSCNLASLDLSKFFVDSKFDWIKLEKAVEEATTYLNGVVDNNRYPIEKIRKESLGVRPIGLGVMGLANLFYLLNIPYGSEEAYKLTCDISKFITLISMRKSMELAKQNKKTYPYYDYDVFMDANKRFFETDKFMNIDLVELKKNIKEFGLYNSCLTSIAPTGTISYIADCSGGIEPVFGLVYSRKIEKVNKTYETVYMVDPVFEKYIQKKYLTDSEAKIIKIYEYISNNKGSCAGCPDLTKKEQEIFAVAGDITPMWHIKIQSAASNNISLSVSKTINLPRNCTEKEVSDVYLKAHEMGIIGVTVYREGSREGILVHKKDDFIISKNQAIKRPKEVAGELHLFTIGKHKYYTAVGLDMVGNPYEVFVGFNEGKKEDVLTEPMKGTIKKLSRGDYVFIDNVNKEKFNLTNGHSDDTAEGMTRMLSAGLRHGADLHFLVHQLEKTNGPLLSLSKVLARTLKKYIQDGTKITGEECPECRSYLIRQEGCRKCSQCAWSAC